MHFSNDLKRSQKINTIQFIFKFNSNVQQFSQTFENVSKSLILKRTLSYLNKASLPTL